MHDILPVTPLTVPSLHMFAAITQKFATIEYRQYITNHVESQQ